MTQRSPSRTSRVFTVSFPPELAHQVDALAKEECRSISELFREAFRTYKSERRHRKLETARAEAAKHGPVPYTEEDIQAIVDEIRAREYERRKKTA